MSEPDSKSQQPEQPQRKFNKEQYNMLSDCSVKKDMTDWNEWRRVNPDEDIWLPGAHLHKAHLKGANLHGAHLEGAKLQEAHLEGADLTEAHLEKTELFNTHLESSRLYRTYLQGAKLIGTNLEAATLQKARLQGACFDASIVNGRTVIRECTIDQKTDFTSVSLDAARVEPGLKQSLEYNIRRKHWRKWYEDGSKWMRILKKISVQTFWEMSDYGRSTPKILQSFVICTLFFACVYLSFGMGCYWLTDGQDTGMIANLLAKEVEGGVVVVPGWLVPVRVLYFSVVTMTTLGFGDMYAQPDSFLGHICLGI